MIAQGQGVRRGAEVANLRDQAYEGYTRSLLAREIAPGQFITQRELVEITGYPLGAIRELVPRLEAEGLIRTVPHRGMQVPQVDLNLIRNAFQFRLFMEEAAVRIFAREADDEAAAGGMPAEDDLRVRPLLAEQADQVGNVLLELADMVDVAAPDRIFAMAAHVGDDDGREARIGDRARHRVELHAVPR